jgi:N-methylhydantoinase B/oxoprolinase/acetone carboxylase alpha subunit
MRKAIAAVPDGRYPAEGLVEQMEGREDVRITLCVTVDGDRIEVDFQGSSGQVDWGGNVVYNFTYAYVFMALKSMFDPDLPNNHGSAAPIVVSAPEGSVVNCRFPAAVAARMQIGHFVTEIIYQAMAEALPDRVIASSGGTPATMNVFYGRRKDRSRWHSVIIRGGGMGAGQNNDGYYDYIFPANGANTPVEIFESNTPLIVQKRELLTDSGGPGRTKGGLGRRVVFSIPDDDAGPLSPVNLGIQSGRFRYPATGLFGGGSGSRARFLVNGSPGNPYGLTRLEPGDEVLMDAPGGGGFGDPCERDPALVAHDVRQGYVSLEQAEQAYKVVLDPETLVVDDQATQSLREG